MKIEILVGYENGLGDEEELHAEATSFESAYEELAKLERYYHELEVRGEDALEEEKSEE